MKKKKILVIDDEKGLLEELKEYLSEFGYEVELAEDGDEGYQRFQASLPDLIITDVLMPKSTGYQLISRIKATGGKESQIPIIVISAKHNMRTYFEDFSRTEFVEKAFKPEDLLEKIRALLDETKTRGSVKKGGSGPVLGRALVAGCKKFLLDRIRDHLVGRGFSVVCFQHEDEAAEDIARKRPEFIFCQYWDDPYTFDAVKLYENLRKDPATAKIPFYVFYEDIPSLKIEAAKTFALKTMVPYKESSDILKQIDIWVRPR
ncbi:MAG: response regulator [Candidatus Omnitrophota bacterium]